jgi:hypothetical protein
VKTAFITVNLVLLAVLGVAFNRDVYSRLGPTATRYVDRFRSDAMIKEESRAELSTYYEDLMFEGGSIKGYLARRYEGYNYSLDEWDPFDGDDSPHWQPTDDLRVLGPKPSQVVMLDRIAHTFNSMGLRDREYPARPAPDTYRIIMLGASNLMAHGIPDGKGFEALLEDTLNAEPVGPWKHFEILNFGYDSYTEVKNLVQIDKGLVFPLQPRLVVFVTHSIHDFWEWDYVDLVSRDQFAQIGYPYLVDFGKQLVAEDRRQLTDAERDSVVVWVYHELLDRCRKASVPCLAVGIPLPNSMSDPERLAARMNLIRSTGMPVISLHRSLDGRDLVELQREPWDDLHLNAEGHRIMARDLHRGLLAEDAEFGLGLRAPAPEPLVTAGAAK